ncbi:sugar transporter SWEET1 [Sitophilus oryzae]|uniref:Sugar transporter SWEET n=1 Tax=Sitophilus oryzae TaxID=7048 RepID=A0A6J2YEC2_SITOR|nr:sugar transporter SWEET1 [Sitophilus oryzae]XP_030761752.1 sugar transporter SWEET1 [Sitophilus oryzae]
MEALSNSLQPYKNLVAQTASIVTILQFFSGVFICRDIYNKKSTKGISSMPFIGGVTISVLNLKYGLLLSDSAMITVNVVAIVLNLAYSVFFYLYAEDKVGEFMKPAGIGAALTAVLLGYCEYEHPDYLEFRFGLILTVLMLALLGSPLIDLKEIIRKKDASSIPFPLTFMATLVTFLWLLYGVILLNNFMILQNFIGFVLSLIQLILLFLFPGNSSVSSPSKKKKAKSTKRD